MTENNRSVQMFIDAINSDAISKCDEIENELKHYTQTELQEAQLEADKKAEEFKKYEFQRIQSSANRSRSSMMAGIKKQIVMKRDSIEAEVFEAVKKEIGKFTASEKYEEFLLKSVQSLVAEFKDEEYELYIRKEDEKFIPVLKEYGEIKTASDIILGGIRLISGRITADDTLDKRLTEQEEYFRLISEMEI